MPNLWLVMIAESGFGKMSGGGEEALCITFPTLFSLAVQKDAMIREI